MTLEGINNITGNNPEIAARVISRWLSEDQDNTGCEKAAVLMASVNFKTVNKIYYYLRKDEIERIALKVEQLEKINEGKTNSKLQKLNDLKKTNSILREFNEKLKTRISGNKDGSDYANKLLGTKKP